MFFLRFFLCISSQEVQLSLLLCHYFFVFQLSIKKINLHFLPFFEEKNPTILTIKFIFESVIDLGGFHKIITMHILGKAYEKIQYC